MDEADRAQAAIEVLEAHRDPHKRAPHLEATGRCHYCDALIRDQARWCDAECGMAWEYEQARRQVNGAG